MLEDAILWRRIDPPGHDACRLERGPDGWRLEGAAAFQAEGGPALLAYEVEVDGLWRTRRGRVLGWIGARSLEHQVVRSPTGAWTLDGRTVAGLERCVDLDLAFTPATNLLPIRRLDLAPGEAADAPAAWFDAAAGTLTELPQRYARRAERTYAYSAPSLDFAAVLEVAASGLVRSYPGLWESERVP